MKRPIAVGLMMILAGTGCDRRPRQDKPKPKPTEWTAEQLQPAKPARSIMRPAIAEPAPEPAPPVPTRVTVPFADPSSRLSDAQRALIDPLVAKLADGTDRIILRGSTDSRGSDKRNLLTSRRRARMVATYFEEKGIARDRISIVALGESRPIAPNMTLDGQDDPAGRARNRRVDIELAPTAGKDEGAKGEDRQ